MNNRKLIAFILGFLIGILLTLIGIKTYQYFENIEKEPTHSLTIEQAEAICIEEGI